MLINQSFSETSPLNKGDSELIKLPPDFLKSEESNSSWNITQPYLLLKRPFPEKNSPVSNLEEISLWVEMHVFLVPVSYKSLDFHIKVESLNCLLVNFTEEEDHVSGENQSPVGVSRRMEVYVHSIITCAKSNFSSEDSSTR